MEKSKIEKVLEETLADLKEIISDDALLSDEEILDVINDLEAPAAGGNQEDGNNSSDSIDSPVSIIRTGNIGQVTAGYETSPILIDIAQVEQTNGKTTLGKSIKLGDIQDNDIVDTKESSTKTEDTTDRSNDKGITLDSGNSTSPNNGDSSTDSDDGNEINEEQDNNGKNNGWGNGDQDAPGNSGGNNQAENSSNVTPPGIVKKEDVLDGDNGNLDDLLNDNPNSNNNGNSPDKGRKVAKEHQDNGFGNGDDNAPGNSGTNNNAENRDGVETNGMGYAPGNSAHNRIPDIETNDLI